MYLLIQERCQLNYFSISGWFGWFAQWTKPSCLKGGIQLLSFVEALYTRESPPCYQAWNRADASSRLHFLQSVDSIYSKPDPDVLIFSRFFVILLIENIWKWRITMSSLRPLKTNCLISASGELFAWGSGRGGKLGYGNIQDRFTPLKVGCLADEKVACISCNELHSAAVTGDTFVSVWWLFDLLSHLGQWERGKLGNNV